VWHSAAEFGSNVGSRSSTVASIQMRLAREDALVDDSCEATSKGLHRRSLVKSGSRRRVGCANDSGQSSGHRAGVIVPVAMWTLNLIWRWKREVAVTAGSDWLLLLMVLDCSVIILTADLEPLIASPLLRERADALFVVLLVVTLPVRAAVVLAVDKRIGSSFTGRRYQNFPTVRFMLAWIFCIICTGSHIAVFLAHV
jgi:hypothetical protein